MTDMIRFGRVSSISAATGRMEIVYEDREDSVTDEIGMAANRCFCLPKVGEIVAVVHNANGAEGGMVLGTLWNDENPPPEGREGVFREDMDQEAGVCFRRWDASAQEYTLSTEGGESRTVKKSQSIRVGESRGVEVGENLTETVDGDLTETVGGNAQKQVSGDLAVAAQGQVQLEAGGGVCEKVEGDLHLTVSGTLTIQAGGCSVTIGGGSITVSAPAVNIDGSGGDVKVNGVSLVNHTHKYTAPLHPQGTAESVVPTK